MPFLDEQELASLHQEIHDANVKKDEIEIELNKKEEKLANTKRKALGINLFFATLAGFAIAGFLFLYQQKNNESSSNSLSDADIKTIQQETTTYVLDSIANIASEDIENDTESIDKTVETIKNNTQGEEVYSVQIGVFSENKQAVLSKTLAGVTSSPKEGLIKYSLGLFKTLEEAQELRKSLVKIGFEDAFVATYVNGERKRIENPE